MASEQGREVACVYAKAAVHVSLSLKEDWSAWLKALASCMQRPKMALFFAQPLLTPKKRTLFLSQALGAHYSKSFMRFVNFLACHGRLGLLGEVRVCYECFMVQAKGVTTVEVATVRNLKGVKRALEKTLKPVFGANLELHYHLRPEILGGFVAQSGYKKLDASVAGQLQQMKRKIREETVL